MKVVTVLVRGGVIFAKENTRDELLANLEQCNKEKDRFFDFVHVGPAGDTPISVRIEDIFSIREEVDYIGFVYPLKFTVPPQEFTE